MQLHLSHRNLRLTASIHSHAANIVAQVEDYAEIFAAHIVLLHDETAKPKDRYQVKAHLAVRGPDVHAEAKAETVHAAMDAVADKLSRQLRKRKTRMKDKKRSATQKKREAQKLGV